MERKIIYPDDISRRGRVNGKIAVFIAGYGYSLFILLDTDTIRLFLLNRPSTDCTISQQETFDCFVYFISNIHGTYLKIGIMRLL